MSIAGLVQECLRALKALKDDESEQESKPYRSAVENELVRFKIWAGNVSAHRDTGRRSLEYRLRDNRRLQLQVRSLLGELLVALQRVKNFRSGDMYTSSSSDENDTESLDFDYDKEETENSDNIMHDVHDVVNLLYRFSIAVRHPARHDEIKQAATTGSKFFEPFDINHVKAKYPQAETYLHIRLGKAISRRRQYFKYKQEHRRKLTEGLDQAEPSTHPAPSTVASSLRKTSSFEYFRPPSESDVESLYSSTSFAISISEDEALLPPALPEGGENGDPFECPICFDIITVTSEQAWRRHIFEDLPPYLCTYKDCVIGDLQYSTRKDWQRHHTKWHNRRYICPIKCERTFTSAQKFETHLIERHGQTPERSVLQKLVDAACHTDESIHSLECSLCGKVVAPSKMWHKHVSHHLQQLALFSLPQSLLSTVQDKDNAIDLDGSQEDIVESPSPWEDSASTLIESSTHDQLPHSTIGDFSRPDATLRPTSNDPRFLEYSPQPSTRVPEANNETAELLQSLLGAGVEGNGQVSTVAPALPTPSPNDIIRDLQAILAKHHSATDTERRLLEAEQARRDLEEQLVKIRPTPDSMKAPIKFKDAVGRKFSFPWRIVKTWEGMETLIKQAFFYVDVIGDHVHQGHYDLTGPGGEIILPQVWESMIQPDWEITMHLWPMEELKSKEPTIGSLDEPFAGLGLGDFGMLPPTPKKKTSSRKASSSRNKNRSPQVTESPIMPPPPPPPGDGFGDPFAGLGMGESPPGMSLVEGKKSDRTKERAKSNTISPLAAWFAGGPLNAKPNRR